MSFGNPAGGKMGPSHMQAIHKALGDLRALMQQKMNAGDGDEEMSGQSLSDAVGKASANANGGDASTEPSEDQTAMNDDMKRMMGGRPKPPSRSKMSMVSMSMKKMPGKKFGKV